MRANDLIILFRKYKSYYFYKTHSTELTTLIIFRDRSRQNVGKRICMATNYTRSHTSKIKNFPTTKPMVLFFNFLIPKIETTQFTRFHWTSHVRSRLSGFSTNLHTFHYDACVMEKYRQFLLPTPFPSNCDITWQNRFLAIRPARLCTTHDVIN